MLYPTLPFLSKDNKSEGLLPWVIGVMVFLCALSLVAGMTMGRGLENWSAGLSSAITVQIVEANEAERNRQTQAALTLLRATPGVASATVLARAEVMALLSPWLGDLPEGSGLPVPTLIDVSLTTPDAVPITALAARLKTAAPAAQIDDHKEWMGRLLDLAYVVQMLLVGIMVMVILSTISIVIFGCRAGLASQRESIEIMHLIGAEDDMIAAAFDRRYLIHGLLGGLGGVALAGLVLSGLDYLIANMAEGLVTAIVPPVSLLWYLLIIPFAAAALTMATARLTVKRSLSRMV